MQSTNPFPFQTTVQVTFRDLDAMGHVNHAVYFTYMETARTRFFFEKLKLTAPNQLPVILAEANCSYKSAARFDEKLVVGMGIDRIGNKSFDMVYRISAEDGRLVAEGKTVMVTYDYAKERAVAIPNYLNKLLQSQLLEGQTGG